MGVCGACGAGYEGLPKFCSECGAFLGATRVVAEERKVVTALFCDLVGFTALSESADPEDVDRMLTRYFTMARTAIEAFGGVVEKFIGDAVVGVFGVPAAHEDDPERAVRAGLRIAEDAESLMSLDGGPLRLRVGINTGETLVRLGVVPGSGERFLAGDAINTASRIQSVAPLMGVAVGQSTYDATRGVFDYDDLPPATLKGKSEPVPVFHAVATRARLGTDVTRVHDGLFVGRELDLALLRGVFDKTAAASAVQLVTIVGEPGMGKSRLVAELSRHVDARPELVTWRQGRCLPYGDGITYWALAEMVKAHAGILDSDSAETAADKLEAVLPDSKRGWYRQRLLPLVGVSPSSTAEREELFAAWTGFLEHIADPGPTVVVFEDLHWADEPMLEFLEHLADHAQGVPLLVVGTARPELFEHHASYGSGLRNATTISLVPLTDEETSRLVSGLLDAVAVPAEVQARVLERAGGNPLFVEEYIRLLEDRGLLHPSGSSWELAPGVELPLPSSVQALIAARIDTLRPDAKALLADAAVVGKVFWDGALAMMSGSSPDVVAAALRDLTRKQLIRPSRRSSVADQHEYAFWHVLTRDVAYAQLPRAMRASRHEAAARWIESRASERIEDLADVLAYHYGTALGLARAAQQVEQVAALEEPARRFLTLAGERSLGLDTDAALVSYEKALALTPPEHPDRGRTLMGFGQAAFQAARYGDASVALDEAIARFEAAGDTRSAAAAMVFLSTVLSRSGDPRAWPLVADAVDLLEPLGLTPELVGALTRLALHASLLGRHDEAIVHADQALDVAQRLGMERPAQPLAIRGGSRALLGDRAGLNDYRSAADDLLRGVGSRELSSAISYVYGNFGNDVGLFDGPGAALAVFTEGAAILAGRGLVDALEQAQTNMLDPLVDLGRLDEARAEAERLARRLDDTGNLFLLISVRCTQFRVHALRGEPGIVAGHLERTEAIARATEDPQFVVSLGWAALVHSLVGELAVARSTLEEIAALPAGRETVQYPALLPTMTRTALALGHRDVAEHLADGVETRHPITTNALASARASLAEASGDVALAAAAYADAAGRWQRFGTVTEHGYALLGRGRCLLSLGQTDAATPVLREARAIFDRLGAVPALADIDNLMGAQPASAPDAPSTQW